MKILPLFFSTAGLALANTAPTVVIKSAEMRPGTTLMDVVYRVEDPDDATVKTRALAFIDGVRSFAKVIRPVSFVEGTGVKLGDSIPANADHTLTWDVAADWNIDLGKVKFEVLAMDTRGFLSIEWITIPAANGEPTVTVSKDSPTQNEIINALFWQFADGDEGLSLANGVLSGSESSGVFSGVDLVKSTTIQAYAAPFVFKRMNLDPYGGANAARARAGFINLGGWHAARQPYGGAQIVRFSGGNSGGQINISEGLGGVIAVATNNNFSLILKGDGTVVRVGGTTVHNPPAGLSEVIAIAVGSSHGLALKSHGTVVGWGVGGSGIPAGLSEVTAIAAGYSHSLALKSDGTVVGWGSNSSGQATVPAGLSGVIAIAAGDYHSLALKGDGTVVGWGGNSYGEATIPDGLSGIVAIAAGDFHNLAIKNDGTVAGWGRNSYGEATIPDGLSGVVAIAGGDNHSLALKSDGTVIGWGRNASGQVTIPSSLSRVVAIAAGSNLSFMVTAKEP